MEGITTEFPRGALPVVTVSAESSEVVVKHNRCEISDLLVFQKARKSASGDLGVKKTNV